MGSIDTLTFDTYIQLKTTEPSFCIENGMTLEAVRLKSFEHWPLEAPVYPTILAKSGLYYTGSADEVACFSCKCKLGNWTAGDDPHTVHQSRQPSCDFVNGRDKRNVPWAISPNSNEQMVTFMSRNSSQSTNDVSDSHNVSLPLSLPLSHRRVNGGNETDSLSRYAIEEERLKSFVDWPHAVYIKPETLANAGFYFIGQPDRVKCHFCSGILRNWERGDMPMQEHKIHFPSCPFVCGRQVGNVPKEGSPEVQAERNGVMSATKFPELVDYKARLATFQTGWPRNSGQKPELLAEAGFFYTNTADYVKCFHCGGALRNWEEDDLPFKEHARWFPRCQFLKNKKGEEYIKDVQEKPTILTPMAKAAAVPERSRTATANAEAASASLFPSGVEYRVDPREVKARLDTPAVKTVLGLGYSKDVVKHCLDQRLRTTGDDFPSAESLLEAIFVTEELGTRQIEGNDGPSEGIDIDRTGSAASDRKTGSSGEYHSITDKLMIGDPQDFTEEDPQSLMQENRSLRDQRTCKVCMDEEVNVVFLPCRHLVCCNTCAPALSKCPVCRAVIRGTVKVFAT